MSYDLIWHDVLPWGIFLIVPDSWSLNSTTYREIFCLFNNQEQYACVIRMIGELEMASHFATEKNIRTTYQEKGLVQI